MNLKIFIAAFALASAAFVSCQSAFPQTAVPPTSQNFAVDMPFCSLRAPFCWPATYGIKAQMEFASTVTPGTQVLIGTAVKKPPVDFVTTSVMFFDFTGSKTVAAVDINAIRFTFTIPDTPEHRRVADLSRSINLTSPVRLLAGQSMGCRYDMPAQSFSIGVLNAMLIVWNKEKTGNIRCAVGMKAADIPAPLPPVAIAPPAPPALATSKPGNAVPPLTELVALDGSKWTFSASKIFRNGVDMAPPYTDLARIYIANDNRVCTDGSVYGYLCWTGSAWGN